MARVGLDIGALALQCITLTPTADNEWFDLHIYSNNPNPNANPNPNPNPNPNLSLTPTLNVNVSLADGNKC